jgi:hypothetical protein
MRQMCPSSFSTSKIGSPAAFSGMKSSLWLATLALFKKQTNLLFL